jgi:hypothetical protein
MPLTRKQLAADSSDILRDWVVQITSYGFQWSSRRPEHQEDSGAHIKGSPSGRRRRQNKKERQQTA